LNHRLANQRKRLGDLTKPARKVRLGTSRLAIFIGAARATGAFDLVVIHILSDDVVAAPIV
jgi:hypothetical protein